MAAEYHAHFTPSLMSAEALEATFVQRHDLARRLLDLIRDSALTETKHHTLLVGPRGIGKTHLVSLLYHRVKAEEELKDRLGIAWLREEEWGVSSFLDLLLRILRALVDEYQEADLSEAIERLYELDPGSATREAQHLLQENLGDRTLLLIVENLDDLLTGLGKQGQQQLRALVQNDVVISILATTSALFQGVSRKESPFYGFFRIHHLDRLTLDEAVDLIVRSLRHRGKNELAETVASAAGRARIRVIHHLAGGNHRVYSIFGQFLNVDSLDKLVAPTLRTLDDLTPYYQAKIAKLAPLQRKIVEVLCEKRGAVSVQNIAKLCFASAQTTSRQLTALRKLGYVTSETYGRQSYYELSEPLMRLSVEIKKSRGAPIRLLVDFLRLWFSKTTLQSRLLELRADKAVERGYLEQALIDPDDIGAPPEIVKKIAIELESEDPEYWWDRGRYRLRIGQREEALDDLIHTLERDSGMVQAWIGSSFILSDLGQFDLATDCCRVALELAPSNVEILHNSAVLFYRCGRRSESLAVLQTALQKAPRDPWLLNNYGVALFSLGRQEQAIESFHASMELREEAETYVYARLNLAAAQIALNREDEGTRVLDEALELLAKTKDIQTGDDTAIVRNLLMSGEEPERWPSFLEIWIRCFKKHQLLAVLGHGLVHSIPAATSEWLPVKRATAWLRTWLAAGDGLAELQLPLRLLKAAVECRTSSDRRVLYSLPREEREILQPLLRFSDDSYEHVERRIRELVRSATLPAN